MILAAEMNAYPLIVTPKLILINAAFSIFLVGIAILVMYFWLTWIDLVYPFCHMGIPVSVDRMRRMATRMAQAVVFGETRFCLSLRVGSLRDIACEA